MDIFQILTIVLLSVSTLILIYLAIKQYKSSNKSNLNKNDIKIPYPQVEVHNGK